MVEPTRTMADATPRAEAEFETPDIDSPAPVDGRADTALLEADLLVEDVSIDGMCGVY